MVQGYSLEFKMFMEGVATPFNSATIICTPNGVEASINIYANRAIYDLKPKTAVQIFYRDWIPGKGNKLGWRLMFDGFYSSIYKVDAATEGRMVSIVCRDFRMDIRRAPAAIAYSSDQDLGSKQLYSMNGLFQTYVVKGINPEKQDKDPKTDKSSASSRGVDVREYGGELNPLSDMLKYVAGTAYGIPAKQKNGEYHYTASFGNTMQLDERGKAKCGFFLDALVRGLWAEAVGGTTVGQFINKRARIDKRFLIPSNRAGYNIWSRQSAGLEVGSYLLGNAQFTSVEAAIMRVAGLFATRVYSCNTPTLINIGDDETGKPNPSAAMIMDDDVRNFLVKRASAEFGAKYILNETMLLPALEFTAPPNCNIFLPPMYDRVVWQYDVDSDVTRGYYKQVDSLSAPGAGASLASIGIQVPNALFDIYKEESAQYQDKTDPYGRRKPPLTLEERYSGVNVSYGSVEYNLAADDSILGHIDHVFSKSKAKDIRVATAKLRARASAVAGSVKTSGMDVASTQQEEIDAQFAVKQNDIQSRRVNATDEQLHAVTENSVMVSMKRHALLKFMNEKFAGRVVNIDMAFNPYVMCGFPGLIIDDEEAAGAQSAKSLLGMVQQVKHSIYISSGGAEATTHCVLNNARFIDEPVDIDAGGNPLYMKATDPTAAKVDSTTLWYPAQEIGAESYHIPEPKAGTVRRTNSKRYDLAVVEDSDEYVYAKDLLSITLKDSLRGESNVIYIDEEYEPQKIARFYRDVLKHSADSFMVGSNGKDKFVYDTIHEAAVSIRNTRKDLLYDYTAAMKFISRDVCSADAFFQGILGLSILDKSGKYICNQSGYDDTIIYDEYYGVTTDLYDGGTIDDLKSNNTNSKGPIILGMLKGPGYFSSILETMPITALIQERRDAVKNYISEASKMAQGMTFSLPTSKG